MLDKKSQKGFTLIETIVVIGIFAILSVILFLLFDNYNKVYRSQEATTRTLLASSLVGNELQNYALQASAVMSSYAFASGTYTTASDTLVLKLPAADSSGNLISGQYDYVAFYVTSGKLYEKVEAYSSSFRKTETKLLSDTVSSVSYTYNNGTPSSATQIDVDIIMNAKEGHANVSHELKETLYLKNI